MPLTNYALDKFVAPEISKFPDADIPDMSAHDDQQPHWLLNFVLNSMFRVQVRQPYRAYIFVFLRRTHAAFEEYELGRQAAMNYIGGDRDQPISPYLRAVHHFETFLAQAYQANELCLRLINKRRLFEKGDGSVLERLNLLYNETKHMDSAIASGDLPGDTTMPVWLTNEGVKCSKAALMYQEMAELLAELAKRAKYLSNPTLPTQHESDG